MGQLGNGGNTNSTVPVQVTGLTSGVTALAVGYQYACAVHNGAVKCWGSNNNGQLGNGFTLDSTTPVQVSGLTAGVKAVSAGYYHACAIDAGNAVKCWGYNGGGQLGNNSTTNSNTPVSVSNLAANISAITTGDAHTCALNTSGTVFCWGENDYGQLGNGTVSTSLVPSAVVNLSGNNAAIS